MNLILYCYGKVSLQVIERRYINYKNEKFKSSITTKFLRKIELVN